MMASPNLELSLDNIAPYLQLEEYLSRLEDERLKIDAFKRELPLCMDLLSGAVEASKQKLQSYKATTITNQGTTKTPILEEFIPIKHLNLEAPPDQQKPPATTSDKASWLASARLWSPADEEPTAKRSEPLSTESSPLDNSNKSGGVPLGDSAREIKLTFTSAKTKMNGGCAATTATSSTSRTSHQTNRKRRRLWSPDLHRRFLDALQILGGSRVTARQIQELMKVDGLTHDEVKSHLQKYKLDTRRAGPSPQGSSATGPQSVVLGGMLAPPEYASAAHRLGVQGPTSIYGAQPTAQMGLRYYPQEFYSPPPPPSLWLKSHGGRRESDRSESVEDGKCESSSDGKSNGRKKLASQALVS